MQPSSRANGENTTNRELVACRIVVVKARPKGHKWVASVEEVDDDDDDDAW